MSTNITTIEEARKLTYGFQWSRKPYKEGQCCESIYPNERGASSHQCTHKNGHGPSGLYCKRHNPDAVKARRDAADKEYQERWAKEAKRRKLEAAAPCLLSALQGLLKAADALWTTHPAEHSEKVEAALEAARAAIQKAQS